MKLSILAAIGLLYLTLIISAIKGPHNDTEMCIYIMIRALVIFSPRMSVWFESEITKNIIGASAAVMMLISLLITIRRARKNVGSKN